MPRRRNSWPTAYEARLLVANSPVPTDPITRQIFNFLAAGGMAQAERKAIDQARLETRKAVLFDLVAAQGMADLTGSIKAAVDQTVLGIERALDLRPFKTSAETRARNRLRLQKHRALKRQKAKVP